MHSTDGWLRKSLSACVRVAFFVTAFATISSAITLVLVEMEVPNQEMIGWFSLMMVWFFPGNLFTALLHARDFIRDGGLPANPILLPFVGFFAALGTGFVSVVIYHLLWAANADEPWGYFMIPAAAAYFGAFSAVYWWFGGKKLTQILSRMLHHGNR